MVRTVARIVALALAGVVVATVGVGAHRALGYLGLALALLLVAVGGVFARAWGRWLGFAGYATGWAAMTMVYAQVGPARSILIADDAHGRWWLFGGTALVVLLAFVPRRLIEGRDVTS